MSLSSNGSGKANLFLATADRLTGAYSLIRQLPRLPDRTIFGHCVLAVGMRKASQNGGCPSAEQYCAESQSRRSIRNEKWGQSIGMDL